MTTHHMLQNQLESLKAKERLSLKLRDPTTDVYRQCVLYMVYKTVELNRNITAKQLVSLLGSCLPVRVEDINWAITSLTSSALFNCLSRWQPSKTQAVHLRVKKEFDFSTWLTDTVNSTPELEAFEPPVLIKLNSHPHHKQAA